MGSMHTGLEDSFMGERKLADYFEARARGGVGLIITGGYSPNLRGKLTPMSARFSNLWHGFKHKVITDRVHQHGAKICLQLLHAGRYAYHPLAVAPSKIKSPISLFTPSAMSERVIQKTISDFSESASLAKWAGYDGVEIMGSEGYLLHEFVAPRTNHRTDAWGGTLENRLRLPLEIVKATRKSVGPQFAIIFRISILDLVEGGSTHEEIIQFAKALEAAGASALSTGIGWHEARIPTIASMVPPGAFRGLAKQLKSVVQIPVIATNRFNTPEMAESALTDGDADLISMARPFLADPDFAIKAKMGKPERINTCIACNQACLDHIFQGKLASCLVNPRAAEEWNSKDYTDALKGKKVLVVGGGPAGLSAARETALAGASVTLLERSEALGGQFRLAQMIPGKSEFKETVRYFKNEIERLGGKILMNQALNEKYAEELSPDAIVLSCGVTPRVPEIDGLKKSKIVFPYDRFIRERIAPGKRIVIIGAGGIGFDIATYCLFHGEDHDQISASYFKHWGIDLKVRAGVTQDSPPKMQAKRAITMLQRKEGAFGQTLGKTTGWIHRSEIKRHGVNMISGVTYKKITDTGILIEVNGEEQELLADQIILCAGQTEVRESEGLGALLKIPYVVIGGQKEAGELDAKRAIRDGLECVAQIAALVAPK